MWYLEPKSPAGLWDQKQASVSKTSAEKLQLFLGGQSSGPGPFSPPLGWGSQAFKHDIPARAVAQAAVPCPQTAELEGSLQTVEFDTSLATKQDPISKTKSVLQCQILIRVSDNSV